MADIDIAGRAPAAAAPDEGEPPRWSGLLRASSASCAPRNASGIPGVTMLGTIATVVYLLSLTVVFGIVPTSKLAGA